MSENLISVASIALLFGMMVLSVPLFVSMGTAAFLGFLLIDSPMQALDTMGQIIWQSSSIFELVATPLFIFAGILMGRIEAGRDLFNATNAWVGNVPNALGVATISACGIFAAICGSSIANAATVGLVAIPLLMEERYTKVQAGGFVAGGGTLFVHGRRDSRYRDDATVHRLRHAEPAAGAAEAQDTIGGKAGGDAARRRCAAAAGHHRRGDLYRDLYSHRSCRARGCLPDPARTDPAPLERAGIPGRCQGCDQDHRDAADADRVRPVLRVLPHVRADTANDGELDHRVERQPSHHRHSDDPGLHPARHVPGKRRHAADFGSHLLSDRTVDRHGPDLLRRVLLHRDGNRPENGWSNMVTNSAKLANIIKAHKFNPILRRTEDCVAAATLSGEKQ